MFEICSRYLYHKLRKESRAVIQAGIYAGSIRMVKVENEGMEKKMETAVVLGGKVLALNPKPL